VTPAELTEALHRLIPLTDAMGATVDALDDEALILRAPLSRNHNHAGSAFAGSIYALASVAGWAFLYQLALRQALDVELLLADGQMRYRRPLVDTLEAHVRVPLSGQQRLIDTVRRGRRARLQLTIALPTQTELAAEFDGLYVALPRPPRAPAADVK
jgi:thioesterase domain-containing protein